MRKLLFAIFAGSGLVSVMTVLGMERPPQNAEVHVYVEQLDAESLHITFELKRARRELIFASVPDNYRSRRWEFETTEWKLLRRANEDYIVRSDGKKFTSVSLVAKSSHQRFPKEYQPISRYGEDGLLVYTGHIWPIAKDGLRANAVFSFAPLEDAQIVSFGQVEPKLDSWRSPMAHPAFVYMGNHGVTETEHVLALVDPATPSWIADEFNSLTAGAFLAMSEVFGFSPRVKPNLFLSSRLGNDESRLAYAGDALPAQFQITLEGAAWNEESEQALDIFRRSTVHEAVHLWQAAARPGADGVAAWIHEGGADAITAEILVSLGLWTEQEYLEDLGRARNECARYLAEGPLRSAERRKAYRALYACGHIIAVAISRAEQNTVGSFWRDFVMRASNGLGYSDDLFFILIEEKTGDDVLVNLIKDFVRTPHANPKKAIDRLFDAVGSPLAPPAKR